VPPSDAVWTGCHGVRLEPTPFSFSELRGEPLAAASIASGTVDAAAGDPIWTQEGAAANGAVVRRWLTRRDDGVFVLDGNAGPRVAVDTGSGSITVGEGDAFLVRQLLAAFALPLLLHDRNVLLVHGAACMRDGSAIVVIGVSGAGKSSSLVALTDAGWAPISEDVCAIDLRGDTPMVWPGPPWVRVLRGEPGPAGAPVVAEGADKTAWAIAERQPGHAAPLGRIIALGGGDAPTTTELSAAAAMQALAPHTVWLTEPEARVATLFPRVASVASAVPATGVSLPRHAGWRDDLLNLVRV
jgi:hypothetical protein